MLSLQLNGQAYNPDKSILIGEVSVRAESDKRDYLGFKSTHLDSALLAQYNHHTIADLLSGNSVIHIKSYGSGGLATPSFRGTGPSHTRVSWNDVNLNSPMLGQFDLSLIPAGFIDDVNIYYGAGSMGINSGGFGGVIDLKTSKTSADDTGITINPGLGSYGRFTGLIKAGTGNEKLRSVTKAFLSDAKNNYPYTNNVSQDSPKKERRENNEVSSAGFIQELYLLNPDNTISARLWYQSASRNLPVPIISPAQNPPEKQDDESLRAMVSYSGDLNQADIGITAAFIADRLRYNNELASIRSVNNSRTLTLKGSYKRRISDFLLLEAGFSDELSHVSTSNYKGNKSRNLASFDLLAESMPVSWLSARLLVRELLHDDILLTPDFSLSTEFRPFPQKYYFLKTSISKNSKVPTLNDMYWSPGGNPDLRNETGYSTELTWEMNTLHNGPLKLKSDITFFRNNISNLIQWRPGEFSFWEAVNLGSAITEGLETGTNISYSFNKADLRIIANYVRTLARSQDQNSDKNGTGGNRLIYVPENQLNVLVRLNWLMYFVSFSTDYTGKRYITADNSQYLPHYAVSGINLGTRLERTHHSVDLSLSVDNLFDAAYQNIAYYPMPGRNICLSVSYQFKK
ncbi:MAG: TonB-dependent receptor [Bacteroidales bacterium]|nr:TonB-dependent receptor [Bacteroidales bacterium]